MCLRLANLVWQSIENTQVRTRVCVVTTGVSPISSRYLKKEKRKITVKNLVQRLIYFQKIFKSYEFSHSITMILILLETPLISNHLSLVAIHHAKITIKTIFSSCVILSFSKREQTQWHLKKRFILMNKLRGW